jgi:ABC-type siderophore export system fused ATPase/permease subunit
LKAAGKTAIVISHDDRYYHVADRVVKLNYGLIEFDSPTALSLEDRVLACEAGETVKQGA